MRTVSGSTRYETGGIETMSARHGLSNGLLPLPN
jgi:hypothetical protein